MIVPLFPEYTELWDEGIVTEKDLQTARRIKMFILFQLAQDTVEIGGNLFLG